jgi:rhomboid protease GluP
MQDNLQQSSTAPEARIQARTRRQAMDWSLVLTSQGIHPVIEHDEESGWRLVVPSEEHDRAVGIIRVYRTENRHWLWRRPMFKTGALFDWGAAAWVALTVVFFWLSESHAQLREAGVMDTAAFGHGQWWRVFTATFLHADLGHLATNAAFGLLLLGLAMGRYGTGVGLLAAFLAGAGGNVAGWIVYPEGSHSLGASGVVMGALGLIAVQSFAYVKHHPRPARLIVAGVFGGLMLFVLLGLNPGSDVIAHLGGFVGGLLLGALLSLMPAVIREPVVNLIAGFFFTALVIWTWMLALAKQV